MMARTLNLYLLRRFVVWLLLTSLVFLALATLGDSFETSKLAARANEGGFGALYLTSLRLPLLYLDLLPFIFLFSTVICLIRLSESREEYSKANKYVVHSKAERVPQLNRDAA